MIFLTLPNFYANYKIINVIEQYFMHAHPEYLLIPISFHAATGNMPYNYWNGGFNNCQGSGATYLDIVQCTEKVNIPLRLNCSNINLTPVDFDNTFANLVLQLNQNGSNTIELCNLQLYEYLAQKYPYYKFVFSKEAEYFTEITPELINNLNTLNIFQYISLPESQVDNFDFISQINNKKNLEVPLSCSCDFTCENYKTCKLACHEAQYNFYSTNQFITCSIKNKNITPRISLTDIREKYLPLGINHFSLGEVYSVNEDLVKFFVEYFVDPKYQYVAYRDLCEVLYA